VTSLIGSMGPECHAWLSSDLRYTLTCSKLSPPGYRCGKMVPSMP